MLAGEGGTIPLSASLDLHLIKLLTELKL